MLVKAAVAADAAERAAAPAAASSTAAAISTAAAASITASGRKRAWNEGNGGLQGALQGAPGKRPMTSIVQEEKPSLLAQVLRYCVICKMPEDQLSKVRQAFESGSLSTEQQLDYLGKIQATAVQVGVHGQMRGARASRPPAATRRGAHRQRLGGRRDHARCSLTDATGRPTPAPRSTSSGRTTNCSWCADPRTNSVQIRTFDLSIGMWTGLSLRALATRVSFLEGAWSCSGCHGRAKMLLS